MRVVVNFSTVASIIDFEPFLDINMEEYEKKFKEWFFVQKNGIFMQRSDLHYEALDTKVIIDWMRYVAPESNPTIIVEQMNPHDVDLEMPTMYF